MPSRPRAETSLKRRLSRPAARRGDPSYRCSGGVTTGVTQKLIAQNRIKPGETTVVCITGNGLKTTDAIAAEFPATEAIAPRLEAFEAYLDAQLGTTTASAKA